MTIPIFFLIHWFLSLFSQTFFLHRYAAHKMFIMNKFWERFFYLFTFITQGSSFLNPRAYAVMHRMHHAYSDTEKDPHSPHYFKSMFRMMSRTYDIYIDILLRKVSPGENFEKGIPEWPLLDRLSAAWIPRVLWGIGYTAFYIIFADAWYWYLLLPAHFIMGPIHGGIVNWFGHTLGYVNFHDTGDQSRNTIPFDLITMGELFQNNHHRYPNSANFAKKWYEFDPTYPFMKMLEWLRIIKMTRTAGIQ